MIETGLSALDLASIASAITEGLNVLPQEITLNGEFKEKELIVTYGASILLAAESTSMATRKGLIITNNGPAQIRVGKNSSAAIYEDGLPIEPGETKVIKLTAAIDLYARAMGYATSVKIMEF